MFNCDDQSCLIVLRRSSNKFLLGTVPVRKLWSSVRTFTNSSLCWRARHCITKTESFGLKFICDEELDKFKRQVLHQDEKNFYFSVVTVAADRPVKINMHVKLREKKNEFLLPLTDSCLKYLHLVHPTEFLAHIVPSDQHHFCISDTSSSLSGRSKKFEKKIARFSLILCINYMILKAFTQM